MTSTGQKPDGRKGQVDLQFVALLAGWPSPTASLADKGVRSDEGAIREAARSHGPDLAAVASLAGWPTPSANEYEPADLERMSERREELKAKRINGNGFGLTLGMAAPSLLTGWATPSATDHKGSTAPGFRRGQLSEQTEQGITGTTGTPSPAPTARRVVSRLNPGFSLSLMGFPETWSHCSPSWSSWDTTERLLAEYYARQDATEPAA